tara:strand:- start:5057 stop:7252 length:2196 start_codon:yes stop_codon:yes gene_type:complete
MAIKKYYADKDNTITNAFKSNLTTRGTGSNMGLSDILETFSIYGQASSGSTELERILIQFPVSEISQDRSQGSIPDSGNVQFYLNMYNCVHSQTTPKNLKLAVLPISGSWEEGTGLDMDNYSDTTGQNVGSNWINAGKDDKWVLEGGDYYSSPVFSQEFPNGSENLKVNITSLVEEWIAGTKPNHGVGVHLTSSQEAYYTSYNPRESVEFDQQAFLSGSAQNMQLTGPSTVSIWVYPDTIGSRYLLFWQNKDADTFGRTLRTRSDGTIAYQRSYTSQSTYFSTETISAGQWSHLLITDAGNNSTPSLYINNALANWDTASPGTGTTPTTTYDMFSIGGSRTGDAANWLGEIDDVAHFNKVLTASEVAEIYNGGCPAPIKETSVYENLLNWWVHGDDPRDEIKLGTPPTEASIFDRAGTLNLFATGSGNMTIVTGACSGQDGTIPINSNEIINTSGATETYYTKKFFGRGSEFFFKRPTIEAVWDSSIKDDRGNFYASSSLLPAEENTRTIYLYNAINGRLRNIPEIGTGEIYVKVYTSASAGSLLTPTAITGGYVSTGIYSASFDLDTTEETIHDRWFNNGLSTCYHTGTIEVKSHLASNNSPYPNYVTNLTNLKSTYYTYETNRFKFYVRQKDWSPTIYTVATKKTDTLIIESGSYQIHRLTDDLVVIPYDTGSTKGTEMSFDVSGNYFDLKMDLLESGYSYGIKVSYYDETVDSYIEQPYMWKFRVEEV